MKNLFKCKILLIWLCVGLYAVTGYSQELTTFHKKYSWKPLNQSVFGLNGMMTGWKLTSQQIEVADCGHDHSALTPNQTPAFMDFTIHKFCETSTIGFKILDNNGNPFDFDDIITIQIKVPAENKTVQLNPQMENGVWKLSTSDFLNKDIQLVFLISNPELFNDNTIYYE